MRKPPAAAIYALASAAGRAGVAVIRISGDGAAKAVQALCRRAPPEGRGMVRAWFHRDEETIDDGLLLWFPGPHSFTGEDVAELQCHGGPAVTQALLEALGAVDGLRPAEPGEFTRRAFENGKLDLAQAEGLAELIDAQTDAQRRAARAQLDGALGQACQDWSSRLTHALAMVEASIDFSDEDLPDGILAPALADAETAAQEIRAHLTGAAARRRLRRGATAALVGAPNAGKSTLMNALTGEDVAITSPLPGTTRDALEAQVALAGLPVTLIDVAGLRAAEDAIERIGVARALEKAEAADLRLFLLAPDAPAPAEMARLRRSGDLILWNKSDLAPPDAPVDLDLSALTGAGVTRLAEAIAERLGAEDAQSASLAARERHVRSLQEAAEAIETALNLARRSDDIALTAEAFRRAVFALGRITGAVDVEDLLGLIFSRFCIGK